MAITREDVLQYVSGCLNVPRNKFVLLDEFDSTIARHICFNAEKISLLYREYLNVPMPDGTKIAVQYYMCRDCGKVMILKSSLETYNTFNRQETDYWRMATGIQRGMMGSYGGQQIQGEGGYVQTPEQLDQQIEYNNQRLAMQQMAMEQKQMAMQQQQMAMQQQQQMQELNLQQQQLAMQQQQMAGVQFDEFGNPIMNDGTSYW